MTLSSAIRMRGCAAAAFSGDSACALPGSGPEGFIADRLQRKPWAVPGVPQVQHPRPIDYQTYIRNPTFAPEKTAVLRLIVLPRTRHAFVPLDFAVTNVYDAMRLLRDIELVRDQDNRVPL